MTSNLLRPKAFSRHEGEMWEPYPQGVCLLESRLVVTSSNYITIPGIGKVHALQFEDEVWDAHNGWRSESVKVDDHPKPGGIFKRCLRCGGAVALRYKWCQHCGARLEE